MKCLMIINHWNILSAWALNILSKNIWDINRKGIPITKYPPKNITPTQMVVKTSTLVDESFLFVRFFGGTVVRCHDCLQQFLHSRHRPILAKTVWHRNWLRFCTYPWSSLLLRLVLWYSYLRLLPFAIRISPLTRTA